MKTKTYSNQISFRDFEITISFTGSDELGKENPENPDTTISCVNNGKNIWKKKFENRRAPGGAWNGFQLIQALSDTFVCGIENEILKLDLKTGTVLASASFGNTPIRYIEIVQAGLLIAYDYHSFRQKEFGSNLLCVANDLTKQWVAELPSENDIFSGSPKIIGNKIQIPSWNGLLCIINMESGKIISNEFKK